MGKKPLLIFAVAFLFVSASAQDRFIIVDDQWIDAHLMTQGSKPAQVVLWKDGVLPLKFEKGIGPEIQATIWEACREWSQAARVSCVKAPYKGRTLTVSRTFMGTSGCWSMLGSEAYFMGMKRRMNLSPGCEKYVTVLHELGHAFGLTHEHQRMDRDKYIDVFSENVSEGVAGFNLKLNFGAQQGDLLTPYDFLSIMHYGRASHSKNGRDTLRPKPQYEEFLDIIGTTEELSEGDKAAIQALYGKL